MERLKFKHAPSVSAKGRRHVDLMPLLLAKPLQPLPEEQERMMKNRFVIVDKNHDHQTTLEKAKKESDEAFLKKTEALTFEGAYGELTASGAGDWAPVKLEILKNKGEKNPA